MRPTKIFGLLPIPILLFLLVVMLAMDLQTVFEPPGLYALLNVVFLTILPLIVSYYATRSYLRSGFFPMLMLGSGTLALGLSGILSGFTMSWQGGGPDATMTIFTWLAFVSAIFHLAGAVSVFTGIDPDRDTRHKEFILALTYIGIAAVALLVTGMVLKGLIPLFFVQGQGPTPLRQVLVGIMTVISIVCGLLFLSVYFFSKAKFLYWYALAMFVFTTALISYMFVKVIGSPIAWLGRGGLYLAGIYLFIAVISASRELRSKGESLAEGISGLFLHHLESLVEERTLQLAGAQHELQTAYGDLERTNAELEIAVDERTSALRNAAGHNDLLQKIREAQSQFISNIAPDELFPDLLRDLLSLTNSDFGFIGEILYTDDGRMYLRDRAITDISWDEESRKIYREFADKQGLNFYNIQGLWGTALLTGEPVISNNPGTDPRRSGTPNGHPGLDSFLGLPFLSKGKVIGMAGLANRAGGYNQELVEFLQPYVATCTSIIEAYRNENRRQAAEKKLFEANQRLQALMDALPVGVSFSDDLSCRNVTGNPCLFTQFEISAQENISASAADPAAPGRLVRFFRNGSEIRDTELPLQRAVAENKIIPPVELEVRLPSGRRWITEASGAPILDGQGDVIGGVAVTVDITEHKRFEESLQEYERVVELLEEMITVVDRDYRYVIANRAFLNYRGLEREQLVGRLISEVLGKEVFDNLVKPKLDECLLGKAVTYEMRYKYEKLGNRDLLISYLPIEGPVGIDRVACVLQDITERKLAEKALLKAKDDLEARVKERTEELARSNQDLQQFAYTASHDLQEPLRNVANCLQMLEQDYKDKLDAAADQYIQYAVESSVRMKDLILGLLDYSRVATKGKAPQPVDCEDILKRALMNLGLGISETDAAITHDPLPTISADDTQMLQVFQNLIQNAIKFRRDEPPQIHISAVKDKNEWIFSVRDNGIGIQSQHLDRIFVIFQQLHKRGKYEGTGMGLAIVKKVIERHGGRIWAESEPGVGTIFYFTIPKKDQV